MILITTYNRQTLLLNLLNQIEKQTKDVVVVIDDGTPTEIRFPLYDNISIIYYRREYNKGKKGYYQTVTEGFRLLKDKDFEHLWMLPDDCEIASNFFTRSLELWDAIDDKQKICLSTGHTWGRHLLPCWTEFNPVILGDVVQTQWNDLCFLSTKRMLDELEYDVNVNRDWNTSESLGSGVGANISRRLHRKGLNMYHVNESLVSFPSVPSMMYRE